MSEKYGQPSENDLRPVQVQKSETKVQVDFKNMPRGARITEVQNTGPAQVDVNSETWDNW